MKNLFLTSISLTIIFLLSGCSVSKSDSNLICGRMFDYSSKKIDVKGISTKLKKAGVEFGDFGVAEISIDSKYTEVSEKMQKLDLYQLKICEQLSSYSNTDPERKSLQKDYIQALTDMFRIANNLDSTSKK
jgi:hypothetical protein